MIQKTKMYRCHQTEAQSLRFFSADTHGGGREDAVLVGFGCDAIKRHQQKQQQLVLSSAAAGDWCNRLKTAEDEDG